MKIKPAVPGSVVRFPSDPQRKLKAEGEDVPDGDLYWHRRLMDGSVVRVSEPAPVAAPAAEHTEHAERTEPTGAEPIAPLTTR